MTEFDPFWPHGHVTEDGRKARYLGEIQRGDPFKYAFAVDVADVGECLYVINAEGYSTAYERSPDPPLLRNAPAPKRKFVRWVNFYEPDVVCAHNRKEDADKRSMPGRLSCIRVEFEEGDGL